MPEPESDGGFLAGSERNIGKQRPACASDRQDRVCVFIRFFWRRYIYEWHLLKRRLHETPACSPDGAQRNPGTGAVADRFPRISLSLHAGYLLRFMLPRCCILDQRRLSKCHSSQALKTAYFVGVFICVRRPVEETRKAEIKR